MSQTKVKSGLLNFPDQTDFVKLPSGTTAQRPVSPEKGYSRYNTTDNKLEFWNGTEWQQLPGVVAPIITSISYPGDDLAADPVGGQTITINGSDFQSGATVTVDGTTPSVITFVSATQITFEAPAKAAGDYDIVVTNPDGGNATSVNGMAYNGVPSWTTPAGNLGSFEENTTIPTITLVASEPDSGLISYSITTGALPTGLTLTGADIDGTTPAVAGETTYNFSVTATDNENQSTERAFNIIVYKFVPSFNTVLWTGNSSTNRSITGAGFAPDLVWIKNRDRSSSNLLFDTVRGATKALISQDTSAEYTFTNTLASFDSDGFTINESSAVNQTGEGIVAWCWRAGGAAVTNTDGTITSQVSANTEAGFSIVSYTGNGVSSATVGHGLSDTPSMVIVKNRTSYSWAVRHINLDSNKNLFLNATVEATDLSTTVGGGVGVLSSSTFGFISGATNLQNVNSTDPFIAYCFAEVAGFSKFGSYVGTGVAGNFQDCGFEPAFIMFKGSNFNSFWVIVDNKRNTTNPKNLALYPNDSYFEESLGSGVNFLPTGFDFAGVTLNSTNTYIYMAFANQF